MDNHDLDHLDLETRVLHLEARCKALHAILVRALKDKGLISIDGVPLENYTEQLAERMFQETLRGLADHDPARANLIAAYVADLKRASQKDKP
jgi:hypothetical protein